jgi:hypothetical protein
VAAALTDALTVYLVGAPFQVTLQLALDPICVPPKKFIVLLGFALVKIPLELSEKTVCTVAVAGLVGVTVHLIGPVASTDIVNAAVVPCVTVTSLTGAASSAVTSSAARANVIRTNAIIMAMDTLVGSLLKILLFILISPFMKNKINC